MQYKTKRVNGEKTLFIYFDNDYEISREFFDNISKKAIHTYKDILNYIKKKKITSSIVYLVVGGIVVGNIILSDINNIDKNNIEDKEIKIQYVEKYKDFFVNKNIDNKQPAPIVVSEKKSDPIIITEKKVTSTIKNPTPNIPAIKKTVPKTEPAPISTPVTEPVPQVQPEPVKEIPEIPQGIIVTLYRYNGLIENILLEEYIIGVVSAEMPASFNLEALKAQSLAARTYTLKRVAENKVLTDTTINQVYKDETQMKAIWGGSYLTYHNKIKQAVDATIGEYIAYNNNYIDAVYHSTSNGYTEDAVFVWGNSFPYLKSVDSHWDIAASSYLRTVTKSLSEVSTLLNIEITKDTPIEIISKTISNRIDEIKIGTTVYKGRYIMTLFGLRSDDYDITINETNATFTTRGYGHGVGMSQYGANGMANEGYTYKQIISHYYPGTSIAIKK